jgi:hypothetical protein
LKCYCSKIIVHTNVLPYDSNTGLKFCNLVGIENTGNLVINKRLIATHEKHRNLKRDRLIRIL